MAELIPMTNYYRIQMMIDDDYALLLSNSPSKIGAAISDIKHMEHFYDCISKTGMFYKSTARVWKSEEHKAYWTKRLEESDVDG